MEEKQLHKIAQRKYWKVGIDFPEWGNNSLYLQTITGGYLQEGESPKMAYQRIAKKVSENLKLPELEQKFFDIMWKGWLIPSTPIMSNMGTDRGLPISCFAGVVGDTMDDILRKNAEMGMLSKHGGGTTYDFSLIRPAGSPIKGGANGTSDGIIPFAKMFDSTIVASKQGKMRRGAVSIYLNGEHKDFSNFLEIREPKGDINRQCHNLHQGAIFSDEFMNEVLTINGTKRELYKNTLIKRVKTGEPYVFYIDNANKTPDWWKELGLKVRHSNLCTEIMLPTDETHTLVCCLSSVNLAKWDEWKDDKDFIKLCIYFLDGIIEEFIQKAKGIYGIEDAVRFAEKSRALGLGVLGWHSLLQSKMIPFISISANSLTNIIFKKIDEESLEATKWLAKHFGEPEWCKGQGIRNLTRIAVAPNRNSSKLGGGVSQSIEPWGANYYIDDDAKGLHIRKNPYLEKLLEEKGQNTDFIWDQINEDKGSVMNLSFLTKEEKDVFKTAKEINQLELVRQAGIRQKYIDQGQSINLFFFQDAQAKFILDVHIEAWKLGLKSLYYLRSESILRADSATKRDLYSECVLCEA